MNLETNKVYLTTDTSTQRNLATYGFVAGAPSPRLYGSVPVLH